MSSIVVGVSSSAGYAVPDGIPSEYGEHIRLLSDMLVLAFQADLTRIAARNSGRFDAAEVARFIDGRERIAVHGSPEMPAWGRRYDDRREYGFRDETLLAPGTILLLVDYLGSIQAP